MGKPNNTDGVSREADEEPRGHISGSTDTQAPHNSAPTVAEDSNQSSDPGPNQQINEPSEQSYTETVDNGDWSWIPRDKDGQIVSWDNAQDKSKGN
ncbi:MAG: hypothetical protein M1820_009143 [Bogoriella megaspora]|nr:MAG: hypothetical protein M1820_009143 [Bogoriella megaspora]